MPVFCIKNQAFFNEIAQIDDAHFPQLNDNQNIIEYLESSDENFKNEWSQDISMPTSCGDITDNRKSEKNYFLKH